MYRATTPTFTFTFDIDPDATFKTILITFKQGKKIVLEKKKTDLTFGEKSASFLLTQEETNLFDTRKWISIQVRALTTEDEAVAFKTIRTTVNDVLNDVVLT